MRRAAVGCLARLLVLATVVAAAGVVFYLQRAPILAWMGRQLVHADPLAQSDAMVVLAGGMLDRELEAADLYAAKRAPLVVLTQPTEPPPHELMRQRGARVERPIEARRRYLRELGVPASAILVLPDTVESTADEAALIAHWADDRRIRDLIVVTSAYHSARARFIFDRALRGSGVTLRVRPARADWFQPDTWWQNRTLLRLGLTELEKTVYYRLRYW